MKEKKNIDRLFQEKFKDFEAQPREEVWAAIAARQKEKQKRVIPLWIKLGGVAAVLALLFLAGDFWLIENTETPQVVQQEKADETHADSLNTQTDYRFVNEAEAIEKDTNDKAQPQETNPVPNSIATKAEKPTVANTAKTTVVTTNPTHKASDTKIVSQSGNNNAERKPENSGIAATKTQPEKPENGFVEQADDPHAAVAVEQQKDEPKMETETTPTPTDPDELMRIANPENAVAEAEENNSETGNQKRWGIATVVAPVYYGDFGGSGIDPQFSNNTKKGEVNLSYGVQISYALNDRVKLRAGVNKVDLGYSTEQIVFSPTIQANSLKSIDYKQNSSLIEVSSIKSNNILPNSPSIPRLAEFSSFASNTSTTSALRQQLAYIEVPIEAEYALIKKRFGMQIIGGVSTLFLNTNSISLEEGSNFTAELGSSNSLNGTSFSTNIGLGFDYRITPKIEFKLEPLFKYQLNAYTNSVSDFKPYYMGLYTGLNIKF